MQQWSLAHTAEWIPAPGPADDKYRRGVLGMRIGSAAYPGAAVLGVSAAWRTGIGLLRYVSPRDDGPSRTELPSPSTAVLAAHPETVFGDGRCDAWVVGSGTDADTRSEAELATIVELLGERAPVVLDAGALNVALEPRTAPVVLTPHRGEFLRLWNAAGLGDHPEGWPRRGRNGRARVPSLDARRAAALVLADKLQATVLLKGSTTVTATPGGLAYASGPATPWLATAGTGDVLAGILGSLVASHASAITEDAEAFGAIAASAAVLHDAAARRASGDNEASGTRPSGGPITALDVAAALPATIAELRSDPALLPRARRS